MLYQALLNGIRGLAGSLVLFPIAERVERRDMRGKQRLFENEMKRSFAERRTRSWAATVDTVRFAAANVPYYRDLFAQIGFDPDSLTRDPRFLADIPPLTKDIIRAEGERLLRSDHAEHRKYVAKTGGSTGPSAHIYYDQNAADWSSAVTRYARNAIGAGPMRSELHFASKFPEEFSWKARLREQVKCLSNNRYNIFFSTFEPSELDYIWKQIKSIRPHLVHGHPSTLYQLALHVEARYGGGKAFNVFESSGELLEPRQREVISRVLCCKVIDRYGLAEIGVAAYQADPNASDMLMFDPLAWPEIIPADAGTESPVIGTGEFGELVLTGTKNRMMPLIRYRTGDLAILRETADGFRLGGMVGRIHDVIEIAGRKLPTHYVQDVLDRLGAIKEFQIEMRNGRPLFRVVPEPYLKPQTFRERLQSWWGDAVDVEFITSSDLSLQGWRAKFRHLVTNRPSDARQPDA